MLCDRTKSIDGHPKIYGRWMGILGWWLVLIFFSSRFARNFSIMQKRSLLIFFSLLAW